VDAVAIQPVQDRTLQKYSPQQIAVANTWADHFGLTGKRADFIRHYLRSTSATRCWYLALEEPVDGLRPALARFGKTLQLFDGKTIRARKIKPADRVAIRAPKPDGAARLLARLDDFSDTPILTSFSKSAREIALGMSRADLGAIWDCAPTEGRNRRYFATRDRFYLTQIGGALKHFCKHLDQDILYAIRSVSCLAPELYNWLATGNKQRRLQALKAQPVLIPLLVMGEDTPWPRANSTKACKSPADHYLASPWPELNICLASEEVCHRGPDGAEILGITADTGLPLNDVLAWFLEVPRSSIRFLGQQRVYDTGGALTHFLLEGRGFGGGALLAGASLGNRRPVKKSHWKSFFAVWRCLSYTMRTQSDLNRIFSGCPVDWDDPAWPHIAAHLSDLEDVFRQLGQAVPYDPRAAGVSNRVRAFTNTSTYHQIGRLVDDFHQALNDIREQQNVGRQDSDEHTRWATLLLNDTPIVCPNGLQIVELRCPADLVAEHYALGHCIDTYDYSAYKGNCRLISVQNNGKHLASAEINLTLRAGAKQPAKWSPRHLHTRQLRGLRNKVPAPRSPEAVAYNWFWQQITRGQIAVNLEWPDMTKFMTRYSTHDHRAKFAQHVTQWLDQRIPQA